MLKAVVSLKACAKPGCRKNEVWRISRCQLFEQRLRLLQIARVETFREATLGGSCGWSRPDAAAIIVLAKQPVEGFA